MIKFIYTSLILSIASFSAQAQLNWLWTSSGGSDDEPGYFSRTMDMKYDANGNLYVCGKLGNPSVVDGVEITSFGASDFFITKYDFLGNVLWTRTVGGELDDIATALCVGSDGSVYVSGFLHTPASINGAMYGPDGAILEGFAVIKFTPEGEYAWIRFFNNTEQRTEFSGEKSLAMTADDENNIYLAGYTYDNQELLDTSYQCSFVETGIFIAQLDSSGSMGWIHFIDQASYSTDLRLAIDHHDGHVYYACSFGRVDNTSQGPDVYINYNNLVLGKISTAGALTWENEIGNTVTADWDCRVESLLASEDALWVGGFYSGIFLLDLPTDGIADGFIARFNNSDGTLLNARSFNSPNDGWLSVTGLHETADNQHLASGLFFAETDFAGQTITPYGEEYNSDNFIASFDENLELNWINTFGSAGFEMAQCSDYYLGRMAFGGNFGDDFYLDNHLVDSPSDGAQRSFYVVVAKRENMSLVGDPTDSANNTVIYPNPISGSELHIRSNIRFHTYTITDLAGRGIRSGNISAGQAITLDDVGPGSYILRLHSDNIMSNEMLIVR